jgi:hypothetical protein
MKEDKVRIRTYLPRKVYVELHKRHMYDHLPFLLAFLLEEFLETGVRISWEEMPNKAEQREYLERKLREFLSRNGQPPVQERPKRAELSSEPSKPPAQERKEASYVQEKPKPSVQEKSPPTYLQEPKPEPVKEETSPSKEDDWDDNILKRIESLWCTFRSGGFLLQRGQFGEFLWWKSDKIFLCFC